jgi:hypothetical protein
MFCCIFILSGLTLSGCSIGGQRYLKLNSYGEGYSDVQLDANTFSVTFSGNAETTHDIVQTYLLYRCAEITVQSGYDYFVVSDRNIQEKKAKLTLMPMGYTAVATIKVFKGEKPSDNPNAYNAKELMQRLEPQIKGNSNK